MSMKHFFEDREGSALSEFLRIPYGQREDTIFTAGSGNLETYVGKHLENQENTAVVYLDTVLNNLGTADIYRELATLSRATNHCCVVIPIVYVEYYFLQSLVGSTVIKDKSLVNLCVSRNYYLGESSLKEHSLKSYDTFERFCRTVCECSLYRCASIRKSGKLSESHYYTNDACPCRGKDIACVEPDKSLLGKASKFVSTFPCIPCGGAVKRRMADLEGAWNAHRLLVKEFNSWSAFYSVAEPKTTFLMFKLTHWKDLIEMKARRLAAGAMSIAPAVTVFSTTAFAVSIEFTDVPDSHWASSFITEMADKGIISGIDNNLFAPSQQLSNAEFTTTLVRQFYSDKLGTEGGTWYAPFMAAAKSTDILAGTSVGSNKNLATSTIDHYDMAQLIYNVLKAEGITTSSLSDTSKVADWASVPSTYRDAVSVCYNMGMLPGVDSKGTPNGTSVMDRAQAAVVMDRLLDICSGGTPSILEKPDGSTPITKFDQVTGGHGAVEVNGGFFFDSPKVTMGYSGLSLKASGHNSITFMVKALDVDVRVSVSYTREGVGIADPTRTHREVSGVVLAGSSKSFTIDCNADESVGVIVADNNHTGVLNKFSNIFVECYFLDLTIS